MGSEFTNYKQINVQSSVSGTAKYLDTSLINSWGVAIDKSGGAVYVASNGEGVIRVYDLKSGILINSISLVPTANDSLPPVVGTGATPTGIVLNKTSAFGGAKLLIVSEGGGVYAWSPTSLSPLAPSFTSTTFSSFTGVTIYNNILYAADFDNSQVISFDSTLTPQNYYPVTNIIGLTGYSPFNLGVFEGKLYVTLAQEATVASSLRAIRPFPSQDVIGNGYVTILDPITSNYKIVISRGYLNSPWGLTSLTQARKEKEKKCGKPPKKFLLVGNVADGKINVYNLKDGTLLTQLSDTNSNPIIIDGLWGLVALDDKIYFAAGQDGESQGLYGYLQHLQC